MRYVLGGFPPTIVGPRSHRFDYPPNENGPVMGPLSFGGISRTRTYDPHDVNVVL